MKNNDVHLIHRILDGDDSAFTELVEKYQKQVHTLAWRKTGDFHIAEEMTQDTFLTAYQKLATLKKPQCFSSWLYVIATRHCNSWLRKRHRQSQLYQDMDITQPENASYSEYRLEENERITVETQRDVVKKLLAKLGESERTVMTLHYFGEMSCAEIGAFLGVSVNTIKSRLRRAQQRLQKEEVMIREAIDNFQISPNLTENIMREISRIQPATPSSSKPLIPWAVAASTLAVVLLMLGFGSQKELARFQQPYNLDAVAEMTVEIIDAPIVANLEFNPDIRTQVGSANAQEKINNPGQQPNDTVATVSEAQPEKTMEDYTRWELPKKAKARLGKGGIHVMQFSPDGTLLAVGSDIGVWLYDAKTGKEVNMFPGRCQSLAFSPDGRFLANGGGRFRNVGKFSGKELQLWEVSTGRQVIFTNFPSVSALRFSGDGKTLVSLNKSRDTISQLDVETAKKVDLDIGERLEPVYTEVYALSLDKLAIGRIDGTIELLDTSTGKTLSSFGGPAPKNRVFALTFSPDGTRLVSGGEDSTVRLWDTTRNDASTILQEHTGWVNELAFSPDGKKLASGGTDKKVLLWDISTNELLTTFTGHINGIAALTFSPDGTMLASGSTDGTIKFWNIATRSLLPTRITEHTKWVKTAAFIKGNTTLASVAFNGIISHWDLKTSQKTHLLMKRHQDILYISAFSPDGTQLVSTGAEGTFVFESGLGHFVGYTKSGELIRLTDVQTGQELMNLATGGSPLEVAFSPNGKTVAFGGVGKFRAWNTETGSVLNTPLSDKVQLNQNGALVFSPDVNIEKLLSQVPKISALAFSPDGRKIVIGTRRGKVQIWDVEIGVALSSFTQEDSKEEFITALSFSSNGDLLAVGSNKRIRVMGSNKLTRFKEVHQGVYKLVFAPASTVLVAGLINGEIKLWDVATGDKLNTLDGHADPVTTLVFSPDGKTLVSTGRDGTILVWDWEEVLRDSSEGSQ